MPFLIAVDEKGAKSSSELFKNSFQIYPMMQHSTPANNGNPASAKGMVMMMMTMTMMVRMMMMMMPILSAVPIELVVDPLLEAERL